MLAAQTVPCDMETQVYTEEEIIVIDNQSSFIYIRFYEQEQNLKYKYRDALLYQVCNLAIVVKYNALASL